jgi:hypothetical protein
VSDKDRPQADLSAILEFNAIGVFILNIDIVPDKDAARDANPAQLVQKRTERSCTWRKPSH